MRLYFKTVLDAYILSISNMIYLAKEFAMIKITAVDPQDLPALLRIERLGFNEAEAGTAAQY